MRKRLSIAAFVLVSAAAVAQPTAIPLGARLKMRWHDGKVFFREGSADHEIPLRAQFDAVEIDKVVLQSAKEAGDFIYLLLDVGGPSKLPRDSHQCGAGTEANLIWLKLDKNWKVLDSNSFLYDSCWHDMSSVLDPPKWTGDTLKVSTLEKVATYTYKHPEEGLKVAAAEAK